MLDGRNAQLADGVQQALGRAPRDFADFARDAAAAGAWSARTRPAMNRRPKLRIVRRRRLAEEAAAVVAALERFMRDTAPTPAPSAGRTAAVGAGRRCSRATGHAAERARAAGAPPRRSADTRRPWG